MSWVKRLKLTDLWPNYKDASPDGLCSARWRFCVSALNLFPKAMLKSSHSKRCRDCRASPNRARRLECGAFTAAFFRIGRCVASTFARYGGTSRARRLWLADPRRAEE